MDTRGRPIFILGCPRSGTTLLGLMLHRHPRIAIPPETRFLLPAYFRRDRFGDLAEPENRRALADMIVGTEWFADLGLDAGAIRDRIAAEAWTVGAAAGLVLRAYADRFGRVRWGDKRPVYRNYVWAVRKMFPAAQFVHLVRDGRDCVASMRNVPPWDTDGFYARVRAWMEAVDHGERARAELPAGTFYELRYERLVNEPGRELAGLCEFLGEPFDAAMLDPQDLADRVVAPHQTWHVRIREPVSTASIGKFRDGLEPWQLEVCEAVMGERLRAYGYELTGAAAPAPECLEEYARVDRHETRRLRRRSRRDRSCDYPWPVADMSPEQARLHRRAAELERRTAELAAQKAELVAQRDAVAAERDAVQARLDRVLGSRTWRWTQPVRRAAARVRRGG